MEDSIGKQIEGVGTELIKFVQEKNRRYGNSGLDPFRVFSKLSPREGFNLRMDDKISRIKNSDVLRKNDVVDLMGYLMLVCINEGWIKFDDLLD
ncbi:MAG: hypothetical protein GY853_01795 [PVC group bacterium]|nr:hypothetical protein [PVC group bacterium]